MTPVRTYSFADLFELVAAAVPDREAAVCGARRLNYAELNERADRLASHLRARGIRAGDRVGLQLFNGSEYLEGFFAACKLRAIPININYRYVADELRYIYDNAGLSALLYSPALAGTVDPLLPEFPGIKEALTAGPAYESALAAASVTYDLPQRSDDDLSLLYTGGTTGMPKGVMWPHKALFFSALGGGGFYRKEGPITSPEEIGAVAKAGHPLRYMAIAPMMHGAAMWAALVAMFAGQTVVMREEVEFNAEKVWDLAAREAVNIVAVVGDAMAIPLLDALKAHPGRWNLSRIVHFGSGGGLFSKHAQEELQALLPNAKVSDSMGSSESGTLGAGAKPDSGEGFIKIVARPDLVILAHTLDRLAEPDEDGVLARSGNVAVGYWGDEEKSAKTFFSLDGVRYAVTGDTARRDAAGDIIVLGRGSQCINSGGEKIFPEEVEEVLHRHPAVADALVVGASDPRFGKKVVAVVALRHGVKADEEMLREFCRQYIAGYKVPKAVHFVDEVMRSPAGKANYRWATSLAEERQQV
jgi:acyl-CoA synthetase (AMP-forming)/AMP-acid ligase II